MDFRSEASPWAIRDLTEDIFGVCSECDHNGLQLPTPITLQVSPASCAESSWEEAPDARVPGSCLDVLPDGRHRTPSPSIACIDPRLTVLWPSPPASLSEEESSASVDDGWTAFDDWDQELPGARVPECVLEETVTRTLNAEGGSNESNTGPGQSLPIRERELRKTRSTVSC
ncbi:hypothetical protein BGY98DRAFT_395438 [Russula aff. rugulosa BPL654]|nr:hypothetical protein BGY98DRAFT_395438 [Russula aff. rugulosa BPL654]